MKYYNKTLKDLQDKLDISQVEACSHCQTARLHDTKEYAKQSVAKHRAISKDIRSSIDYLLRQLDMYDDWVEINFARIVGDKSISTEESM